jgi:hypothetical protein
LEGVSGIETDSPTRREEKMKTKPMAVLNNLEIRFLQAVQPVDNGGAWDFVKDVAVRAGLKTQDAYEAMLALRQRRFIKVVEVSKTNTSIRLTEGGEKYLLAMKPKPNEDTNPTKQKKETKMAKKEAAPVSNNKKAKKEAPPAPAKMTFLRAYQIFSTRVWSEEDRPDLSSITEDQAELELRENISLLAPEDRDEVLLEAPEDGAEAWKIFLSIREDLAGEAKTVEEKINKKGSKAAPKAPKAPKVPRVSYSRLKAVVDCLKAGPVLKADLAVKSDSLYSDNGGKSNPKEQEADVRRALTVLEAAGILKSSEKGLSI